MFVRRERTRSAKESNAALTPPRMAFLTLISIPRAKRTSVAARRTATLVARGRARSAAPARRLRRAGGGRSVRHDRNGQGARARFGDGARRRGDPDPLRGGHALGDR